MLSIYAPQLIDNEQRRADDDGAIGYVESRPMPVADIEIKEVDHMTINDAIDQVADSAPQHQCQRPAEKTLARVALEQVDDQEDGADGNCCEQVSLPAALRSKEAERSALVVGKDDIEEGSNGARLPMRQELRDRDLGQLVQQDDNYRDAEPWGYAAGRGGAIFGSHVVKEKKRERRKATTGCSPEENLKATG